MHVIDLIVSDSSMHMLVIIFNQKVMTLSSSKATDFCLVTYAGLLQSFSSTPTKIVRKLAIIYEYVTLWKKICRCFSFTAASQKF